MHNAGTRFALVLKKNMPFLTSHLNPTTTTPTPLSFFFFFLSHCAMFCLSQQHGVSKIRTTMNAGGTRAPRTVYGSIFCDISIRDNVNHLRPFSVNTHPYMQLPGSEKQAASLKSAALQSQDTTTVINLHCITCKI